MPAGRPRREAGHPGGAAALAALAALLALAPAPAAAWQRVATVAELCAEAGARPITRPTLVRGQGRDGPIEFVEAPCTIIVTRGAVLRFADVAASLTGDGGRDRAALAILLRGGAGLELLRSRNSAYSTSIDGVRSGGPVRLFNSFIGGAETGAAIRTLGDVSLRGSSLDVLRGGGIESVNGSVELLNSHVGGRNSVFLVSGPGGVRVQTGSASGGLDSVRIEARRGGSVTVMEAQLGFATIALTPDVAGRSGAVTIVGSEIGPTPSPDPDFPRVRFELPPEAGCYALDNVPEVACPPPSAGP